MTTIELKNVKIEGYALNFTPKERISFGKSVGIRVDFDSEADEVWKKTFSKIKSEIPSRFIALKKEEAKKSNSTFILDEDEVVVKNPLRQATKGEGENKTTLPFKRLNFKVYDFSNKRCKDVVSRLISEHNENGLEDLANKMSAFIEAEKLQDQKPLAALSLELERLRKIGQDDAANKLTEECFIATNPYRINNGIELPTIFEIKDGKAVTTYIYNDVEKPLYVSRGDTVNITFQVFATPSKKKDELNNTVVLELKLSKVEVVKRQKEFSSYQAPVYLDLGSSSNVETEVKVPKNIVKEEPKSDIDKTPVESKKDVAKKQTVSPSIEKEFDDIDNLLSDDDIEFSGDE